MNIRKELKTNNLVAKYAETFNRPATYRDRTKYHRPDHRQIETGSSDRDH